MGLLDNLVNRLRGKLIQAGEKRSRQRIEPTTPEGAALRQQRENPINYADQKLKSSGYTGLSNLEKIKKRDQIRAKGDKAFSSGSGSDMLAALRKGTSATKATQGITYGDMDKDILAARKTRAARLQKQKDLTARKDAIEKERKEKEAGEKIRKEEKERSERYRNTAYELDPIERTRIRNSTYYGDIASLIRESLNEGKLCPKGKAAAKSKFKVYPSAYANMYASAVCSGKVTPGGKKNKK